MKHIDIRYIHEIENMSDNEIYSLLNTSDCHKINIINWQEYPYRPEVSFNLAYSDKVLAVLFHVTEDHILANALESNGPVWEDSCVEIFIDSHDSSDYFNFETNCIGTRLASRRRSRTDADHFSEEDIDKIRTFGSLQHEKINICKEGQTWWRVVMIPFELIGYGHAPDSLKANFYKCGDKCSKIHFLSWTEIDLPAPDFHCPEFFGEVTMSTVRTQISRL